MARVSGTVTLDGQPVTGAQIVFEDATRGVSVNVPLAADGSYVARTFGQAGLPPGSYQVAVRPGSIAGNETPLVSEADISSESMESGIPERYRRPATSGLVVDLVAGDNPPANFALSRDNH